MILNSRVMIVDDDPILSYDLNHMLMGMGCSRVYIHSEIGRAVEEVVMLKPDLVLLDITFPDNVDGIDAAGLILQKYDVPIIFITADDSGSYYNRIMETNHYGCLVKPIKPINLKFMISNALRLDRLKKELKASENRFLSIAKYSNDWESWISPNGKVLWTNPAVESLTGFTPEEFLDLEDKLLDLVYPADVEQVRNNLGPALKTMGSKEDIVFRINYKGGGYKWVSLSYQPIYSIGGEYQGLRTSIRDVSEKKKAEDALRESETRYRELFNNIKSGVAIFEVIGEGEIFILKDINRAGERIGDFNKSKIVKKDVLELRPVADKVGLIGVFQRVWKSGKAESFSFDYYVDEVLKKRFDDFIYKLPSGEIVSVYDDVTQQKESERKLMEKTEELEMFFSTSLDLLCIADIHGNYRRVNLEWINTFGFSKEFLENSNMVDLVHPEDKDQTVKILKNLSLNIEVRNFVNRNICNDGSYRWLEWRAVPMGQLVYAAARDITERIRTEQEIVRLNRNIMNIQEEERQKLAKDLHDGIGQTMLAAKLNIESYSSDPEFYYDRLEMGIQFMEKASQELREVYTGLYPSILSDMGLEATIRWYAKNVLEINGINVSFDLLLNRRLSHNLEVNLYRIIQEIFSNILKHSKCCNVKIELRSDNDNVFLEVIDDGVGFNTKKEDNTLTGQGLSNIRHRAENFNGTMIIGKTSEEATVITIKVKEAANNEKNQDLSG